MFKHLKHATLNAPSAISISIDTIVSETKALLGSIQVSVNGGSGAGNLQTVWNTGVTGTTINNISGGTYTITVIDALTGCSATQQITVPTQLNVNVSDIENINTLELFPNPATTTLTASIELNTTTDVMLQVINATGKVISTQSVKGTDATQFTINVTDLPGGLYLARFVIENEIVTTKFVVNK